MIGPDHATREYNGAKPDLKAWPEKKRSRLIIKDSKEQKHDKRILQGSAPATFWIGGGFLFV